MWGHIPDIFLGFEFHQNRLENLGAVGVEILAFPLNWHIAYTTACCYRTSRDLTVCLGRVDKILGKGSTAQTPPPPGKSNNVFLNPALVIRSDND